MPKQPPNPDQQEFNELYKEFVNDGGLDVETAVHEDYERAIRQGLYCLHGKPRPKCFFCRKESKGPIGPQ